MNLSADLAAGVRGGVHIHVREKSGEIASCRAPIGPTEQQCERRNPSSGVGVSVLAVAPAPGP